jgi:hypothetical protein
VDHRVTALHAGADRALVGEIPGSDLAAQLSGVLALLGVADEADDLVPACAQLAHDLAADETSSARDEDLHARGA